MKNIIQILVTGCFLMIATQVVAARGLPGDDRYDLKRGVIETHGAIESSSLRIILDASLHGFVEGKICDFCETIKVTITPGTKAYEKKHARDLPLDWLIINATFFQRGFKNICLLFPVR